MTVRPEQIETESFGLVRKGYDPTEVRSYLLSVAQAVRLDDQERRAARQAGESVATHQDAKAIMSAAQQTAASIRAEARRQADDIRDAAVLAAKRRLETAARVPRESTFAPPPSSPALEQQREELSATAQNLDQRARQLETLHKETIRLHQESRDAAKVAANDRLAAERLRDESRAEISKLQDEVSSLNAKAEASTSQPHFGIPGPLGGATTANQGDITVIDSSDPPNDPLTAAVKSAVGRALR